MLFLCLSSDTVSILALKLKIRTALSQGSPLWCWLGKMRRTGRRSVRRADSGASIPFGFAESTAQENWHWQFNRAASPPASRPARPSDKWQVGRALATDALFLTCCFSKFPSNHEEGCTLVLLPFDLSLALGHARVAAHL